ncbi:MAG TPA: hypothetical protein PLI95_09675 [Polyangiaceae bacterium]|nr:hypothetical protein [Polyangiaceae bacterium]
MLAPPSQTLAASCEVVIGPNASSMSTSASTLDPPARRFAALQQ